MEPNADEVKAPESKPGSKPDAKDDLKTLPMPELQVKLGSSPDGLTQAEAQKRLTQYGPNEIEEKKTSPFLKFLSYFWGPIPWMIEVAVILSGVVRHWPDFFIILLLLLANETLMAGLRYPQTFKFCKKNGASARQDVHYAHDLK
jgi:H+-transporting ATPase